MNDWVDESWIENEDGWLEEDSDFQKLHFYNKEPENSGIGQVDFQTQVMS